MDAFIGTILNWPVNFAPRDWAFCDGQLLPISSNASLFSLIGTYYGGDGRTTFALPDLRGRVAVGAGRGPGLSSYQLGQSGGVESVTLSTNEIPSHSHNLSNVQVITELPFSTEDGEDSTPSSGSILASGTEIYTSESAEVSTPLSGSASGQTSITGGNLAHTNTQPFLVLNYIIALQGIYPSRS